MDLMNLTESLKKGRLIDAEGRNTLVLTPLARVTRVNLSKPWEGKPRADGSKAAPKYGLRLIWNWNDAAAPAHVDIQAVLLPAILDVATKNGLNPKGWLSKGDEEKLENADGSWPPGLGPGTVFLSANARAVNNDGSPRPAPTVRDGKKNVIDPGLVKPGYYGRAVISIYAWTIEGVTKIFFGLEEFQLLAKGELLGAAQRDYADAFGEVEGGDSFSHEKPSQLPMSDDDVYRGPDGDDIPF